MVDREELFRKYSVRYDADEKEDESIKENAEEDTDGKINHQRELFECLENGACDTGIKELINMTSDEIEHQYTRKAHMENRAGFLLAFWGVIVGFATKNETIFSRNIFTNITQEY